jgi:RhtB (resistance to homoserine/threonine) family protein
LRPLGGFGWNEGVHDLLPFVAISALLAVTPGVDMALVAKNALLRGRRDALLTATGVCIGLLAWTAAAALGIAALLRTSAVAFTALKLAGAAYLLFLGIQALWASRTRAGTHDAPTPSGRSPIRQGLLTNLLNPKIAVFFTSFIPQFVEPGDSVLVRSLLLGVLFTLIGLVWLSAYAIAVSKAGNALRRPRVKRALDRLTGCVLIAFGIRLATERR